MSDRDFVRVKSLTRSVEVKSRSADDHNDNVLSVIRNRGDLVEIVLVKIVPDDARVRFIENNAIRMYKNTSALVGDNMRFVVEMKGENNSWIPITKWYVDFTVRNIEY